MGASSSGLQQLLLARDFNEGGQSPRFGSAGSSPSRSDPEVARLPTPRLSPFRPIDLGDKALGNEAREVSVQHSGPQAHLPAGALQHVVHHAETMKVAVRERQQDLEPMRRQIHRTPCIRHRRRIYLEI